MVFHPDIESASPFRLPCWRWRRALRLADKGRRFSRKRDDERTGEALRYVRMLERPGADQGPDGRAARTCPEVHAARLLHEEEGKALEAQARLLAGQGVEGAARALDLPAGVVAAYEALFFDVLGSLDATGWIASMAVGWHRFDPREGRDAATVLKAYAYRGGVHVLEAVMPYLLGGRLAEPALDASTPEGRLDRRIRLAIGLDMLPWTRAASRFLLREQPEVAGNASEHPLESRKTGLLARHAWEMLEKAVLEDGEIAGKGCVGDGQGRRERSGRRTA